MSSFVREAAEGVAAIFDEIEDATARFRDASGVRCAEGCGACCLSPSIEARVIEMLPAARHLVASGTEQAWYERAAASADGRCVFYEASLQDPAKGRCELYEYRPSVCRLFGFASVQRKSGAKAFAACRVLKATQPEIVAAADAELAPAFADYGVKVGALAAHPGLGATLPINEALMRAIEKAALETPLADDGLGSAS